MRFAVASLFAFASAVLAADTVPFDPIYTPSNMQEVQVGEPFKITWDAQPAIYDDEPVMITLIGGPTQGTQVPLYVVATGVLNKAKEFVWTPLTSEYGKDWYGLSIVVISNPAIQQYSNPFRVVNKNAVTTTAVTTTAATTTAVTTTAASGTTTAATTIATGTSSIVTSSHASSTHTRTRGNPVVTVTDNITTCTDESTSVTPVATTEEPCDEEDDAPWTGGEVKPTTTPAPGTWTPNHPGTPYTPGNEHKGNTTTLVPVTTGYKPATPTTTFVPAGAAAQGVPMVALAAAALFVFAF